MALTELLKMPSVPVKVTINEYIELANTTAQQKVRILLMVFWIVY